LRNQGGREDANVDSNWKKKKERKDWRLYDSSGISENRPIRRRCHCGQKVSKTSNPSGDYLKTYKWQFRDNHSQCGKEVNGKVGHVVVGVVSAKEEEHNRDAEQKLFGRRVLVAVVDLLPHIEIVVGTGVEFEWDAPHPVKHEEGPEHVADVGEGPRGLLRDTRDDIVENLEGSDTDEVNSPGT
jgi:hypothetical protein